VKSSTVITQAFTRLASLVQVGASRSNLACSAQPGSRRSASIRRISLSVATPLIVRATHRSTRVTHCPRGRELGGLDARCVPLLGHEDNGFSQGRIGIASVTNDGVRIRRTRTWNRRDAQRSRIVPREVCQFRCGCPVRGIPAVADHALRERGEPRTGDGG